MIVIGIAIFLAVALAVAIWVAVHYRATAKAANVLNTKSGDSLVTLPKTLERAFEDLSGDVRDKIDQKFAALGKWLVAEITQAIQKTVPTPAAPDAAASPPAADPASVLPAEPAAPAAETTTAAPSAGGGTAPDAITAKKKFLKEQADSATAQLAEIEAAEGKLQSLVS